MKWADHWMMLSGRLTKKERGDWIARVERERGRAEFWRAECLSRVVHLRNAHRGIERLRRKVKRLEASMKKGGEDAEVR